MKAISAKLKMRSAKTKPAGFVLLFAVTLAGILLAIALGVANIASKEIKFGTSARDTGSAFFAADTGIECAIFYDKSSVSTFPLTGQETSINCAGASIPVDFNGIYAFTVPGLGTGTGCANVTVTKENLPPVIKTTIVSKGYNVGDANCAGTQSNRVEREIKVTYTVDNPTPPTNFALSSNGATASASSTISSAYPVSSVIDGDRTGAGWGAGTGGWNDGTTNIYPDWLQIDFSGTKSISEVDVFTLQDNYAAPSTPTPTMTFTQYGVVNFQVEYWTGSTWQAVPGGSVTSNNLVWRKFIFSPISTTKVRVYVTNALGAYSRLTEVEAY